MACASKPFPPAGTDFVIPGWYAFYGQIFICADAAPGACVPPSIQEGRVLSYEIDVHDAATGDVMFFQNGTFYQDTVPPGITAHSVTTTGTTLSASITVTDAHTSPTSSMLYFAEDGLDWSVIQLSTASNLLDDTVLTRTFTGSAPFTGSTVHYFFASQDGVFNVNYFGADLMAGVPTFGKIGLLITFAFVASIGLLTLRMAPRRS